MSEPVKTTGPGSAFSSTVKGEKAESFEGRFEDASEPEEVSAEATPAEAAVEPEVETAPEGESDGARLVRETKERLIKQSEEQAPGAEEPTAIQLANLQAVQQLKDEISHMGRAQEDVTEPEGGFDFSDLEDPAVMAQIQAAKESDDPNDMTRALATIAQHVFKSEAAAQEDKSAALEKKLEEMKATSEQRTRQELNQQMFRQGLDAAESLGGVEAALIQDFKQSQELESWNAHLEARRQAGQAPSLEGYVPGSVFGAWLMQPGNIGFAATPSMMQAGALLCAKQMGAGTNSAEIAGISTTGSAAPAGSGGSPKTSEEKPDDGPDTLGGMLAAAKARREGRGAFG